MSVFIDAGYHVPCIVDVETTGLDCMTDNLIQVCVLPVKSDLTVDKGLTPFYTMLKPVNKIKWNNKAMAVHGLTVKQLMDTGLEVEDAAESFEEWCEDVLCLNDKRKIAPIAQNYQFDKGFLVEWLGCLNYNQRFHYHYRDTMISAMFINDVAESRGAEKPFKSVSLNSLCRVLGIENLKAHDALADCHAEAEVYQKLLLQMQTFLY